MDTRSTAPAAVKMATYPASLGQVAAVGVAQLPRPGRPRRSAHRSLPVGGPVVQAHTDDRDQRHHEQDREQSPPPAASAASARRALAAVTLGTSTTSATHITPTIPTRRATQQLEVQAKYCTYEHD